VGRLAPRVLLLGWDGADWQIMQPLLDQGLMPHLERLITSGVMGNLATLRPTLSPMLWTSIATGKRADQHGVHGFVEPRPDGRGVRPVASTSLTAQTLWSILPRQGLKSAAVSWYASHPAHRAGGAVVSNYFRHAQGNNFDEWPLPPGAVAPESLREVMADLRVHPAELDFQQLQFFIPEAGRIDQEKDRRLEILARYLAECATVHAAGTYLAESTDWDLLAVYYDTIDRLGHEFMWYRAPKMEHVSDADFRIYREVVDRSYLYHDLMLGRYLKLVGPETTVILVSDHGFFSDHLRPRPRQEGQNPPPLLCHRAYGIFAASGPGIKKDELVFGASLLDVAPTVLTMLGLPVARDMEGRALSQIFAARLDPEFIETYETGENPEPSPTDLPADDPWAAQEALKQLVALGYVEAPPEDAAQAVEMATAQKLFNLAEVHLTKGQYRQAGALFQELLTRLPENQMARLRLAQCHLHQGEIEECLRLANEVFADHPQSPWAHHALGQIEMARQNWAGALEHFRQVDAALPSLPQLHWRMGLAYLRQADLTAAETAFRHALEMEGDNPDTYDGLGLALYRQKKYEEAEECFLRSLGLLFYQPLVHYHLGVVLAVQGKLTPAIQSLQRALEFRPNLAVAHEVLAQVYGAQGEEALARAHILRARQLQAESRRAGEEKEDLP